MESQALVIAVIGVLGIGAQWVAWRTGWPAIVLMLAAGFLAGPILNLIERDQHDKHHDGVLHQGGAQQRDDLTREEDEGVAFPS